jgi:hypothetical protein
MYARPRNLWGDVDIRAPETVYHLRERQGVLQVLINDVVDGGGAGRNWLAGVHQLPGSGHRMHYLALGASGFLPEGVSDA